MSGLMIPSNEVSPPETVIASSAEISILPKMSPPPSRLIATALGAFWTLIALPKSSTPSFSTVATIVPEFSITAVPVMRTQQTLCDSTSRVFVIAIGWPPSAAICCV